jgi:uncharacterized protein YbaR (Trm112 family)
MAIAIDSLGRLDARLVRLLICPCCRAALRPGDATLHCTNPGCAREFPVVRGVPILINEATSLFSIESLVRQAAPTAPRDPSWKDAVRRFLPRIGRNIKARENVSLFRDLLMRRDAPVRVLVLGGVTVGVGMNTLLSTGGIEFVESDVVFGPRTGLICDAHDIPFEGESFDGVIIQGVLSWLLDPARCVAEIHRVLKADGLVYAETPFMQQVTGGSTDFFRFSQLGHRRLLRRFSEISSGPAGGPGMALAWAYKYFLLSFAASRTMRVALNAFAHLTAFWLPYVDYLLIDRPGAIDAASGFFFLGTKAEDELPDRELVELYRGYSGSPAREPV